VFSKRTSRGSSATNLWREMGKLKITENGFSAGPRAGLAGLEVHTGDGRALQRNDSLPAISTAMLYVSIE